MEEKEIVVGRTYCGTKKDSHYYRYVLWINESRSLVQYDSDTVGNGRLYPKVSMEKFCKWAKEEVGF